MISTEEVTELSPSQLSGFRPAIDSHPDDQGDDQTGDTGSAESQNVSAIRQRANDDENEKESRRAGDERDECNGERSFSVHGEESTA